MQSSKPGIPVWPLKDSARAKAKWDPVVKVTHWSIVLAVIGNAIFTEEGSGPHVWVGYALATVLAFRLLWGFVGPKEARFTAFPPSPRKALAHIREIRAGHNEIHPSHNPLGALMVYAIWGTLSIIIATGIGMLVCPPRNGLARLRPTPLVEAQITGTASYSKVLSGKRQSMTQRTSP